MNIRMIACLLAAGLPAVWVGAQGSLTPPGDPAPTMKTLAQVEPRTPIDAVPYVIEQPGSYYLTANLVCTNGSGVTISADAVTLDLAGYAIFGSGDQPLSKGILVFSAGGAPLHGVVVRNGTVGRFGTGLYAERCQGCRFEHLAILNNLGKGLFLESSGGACNGNAIVRCAIGANDDVGVYFHASAGRCEGNRLADCIIQSNASHGVEMVVPYSGRCAGNLILDCTIAGNGGDGLRLDGIAGRCEGNLVERCVFLRNGGDGISTATADGAANGNLLSACRVNGNGGDGLMLDGFNGVCAGNVVADCGFGENQDDEIQLDRATGNRVENNRIDDYTSGGTNGITGVGSTNNLIVRNTALGTAAAFNLSAGDVYGPVVGDLGELATSGAEAHPWANFSP